MKKLLIIMLLITVIAGCSNKKNTLTIGIVQIAEHSSLDELRQGIIQELEKEYKDTIKIDYKNAQSDMNTLNNITQGFVSQKVDLIIAIATPSAQVAFSATKDIPIIFSAVTDPLKAGIVKDLNKPGTNVSGTMDVVNVQKELELLKELAPTATKVGILYNTSEVNSETQIADAIKAAKNLNLEIITQGVTNSNEIGAATDILLKKVDSLYIPTDNLVTSSLPLVLEKTNDLKIPVIGSVKAHVEAGALASNAIDHVKLGEDTAKMAIRVLSKEKIETMAVQKSDGEELIINELAAQKLGITISSELLKNAKIIK